MKNLKPYILLFLMSILWGGAFTAAKIAVSDFSPIFIIFYRFSLAFIIMVLILFIFYKEKFSYQNFFKCLPTGLTGVFLYNFLWVTGLNYTYAGKASIIIAINPVFTAILAFFIFGERLNLKKIIGVIMAFTGVSLIIVDGNFSAQIFSTNKGDFIVLSAAVFWSIYTLIGKKVLQNISAFESVTYSCFWGSLFMLPVFIFTNFDNLEKGTAAGWASISYLAVFATVLAFVWFYKGVKDIGAGKAASFIYFVPFFGVLISVLVLGEPLTVYLIIGGILIIFGIYLINRERQAAK